MNLLPLVVMMSSLAIESTEMNDQGTKVLMKNNSTKTVMAFRIQQTEMITRSRELLQGIKPGATYEYQLLTLPNQVLEPKILGVVFEDGTTDGPEGSVLLARREGIKAAERQIRSEQLHRLSQFDEVSNPEEELPMPDKWKSNDEKAAWNEGYQRTRKELRKKVRP